MLRSGTPVTGLVMTSPVPQPSSGPVSMKLFTSTPSGSPVPCMGACSADGDGVDKGENDDTPVVEVTVERAVTLGADRAVEITAKTAAPSARIIITLTMAYMAESR